MATNFYTMKNYFKLFLIVASTVFIGSCERDDDANFEEKNYLVGKWVPISIGTVNSQNIMLYTPYQNDAACDSDFLSLNANYTFDYADFQEVGGICETTGINGSYRRESRQLFLTTVEDIDGVPTEVEISRTLISLTNDTLEISYTDEDTNKITFLKLHKVN